MKFFKISIFLTFIFFSCKSEVIEVPTNLVASTKDVGAIYLNWDRDFKVGGYNVFRSPSQDGQYELINKGVVTDNQFVDKYFPLESGASFFYKICAVNLNFMGEVVAKSKDTEAVNGISLAVDKSLAAVTIKKVEPLIVEGKFIGFQVQWDLNVNADYYTILKEDATGFKILNGLKNGINSPVMIISDKWNSGSFSTGQNRYKIVPNKSALNGGIDFAGQPSEIVSFTLPGKPDSFHWSIVGTTFKLDWDLADNCDKYILKKVVGGVEESIDVGNVSTYTDSSIDVLKEYAYSLFGASNFSPKIGSTALPTVEIIYNFEKFVTCAFFDLTVLNVASGEKLNAIELSWNGSKDPTINEYKIYRQKVNAPLSKPANHITYPETVINSVADLVANSITDFTNDSVVENNKLLYLTTIPAKDIKGKMIPQLEFEDNNKLKPGLYRYYISADSRFITSTGFRKITDREFIQFVNRHLDRILRLPGINNADYTTDGGGTFKKTGNNGMVGSNKYYYTFTNFISGEIKINSTNFMDDKFKYDASAFYYTKRVGQIAVSGIYPGTIDFFLARNDETWQAIGGPRKAGGGNKDKKLLTEKDLTGSGNTVSKSQGWYKVNLYNVETIIHWQDGAAGAEVFSDALENKVEPDWTTDYILWE